MEQHVSFGDVRMLRHHQPRNHVDDLRQVLRDARLVVRRHDAQRRHVLVVGRGIARADHADVDALLDRGLVDLVVDVRDVARVHDVRMLSPKHARQNVEHHCRPCIADVREAVDGWPQTYIVTRSGFSGSKRSLRPLRCCAGTSALDWRKKPGKDTDLSLPAQRHVIDRPRPPSRPAIGDGLRPACR
jgi:hypothetical protein